eukprot:CAMPEP_0177632850 /NCGR_PEP_ID=MMETSP0447-20121125/2524_1 /TAXON_ID=0 /ORGANISM="Stygamoeba regulata, Strain BSH-02190019" /LENGTH=80 /DNA_ID=CAMNT_0019134471 /DNA_START=193 /DNA_END=435 /DNA_ORIENTATION=+
MNVLLDFLSYGDNYRRFTEDPAVALEAQTALPSKMPRAHTRGCQNEGAAAVVAVRLRVRIPHIRGHPPDGWQLGCKLPIC